MGNFTDAEVLSVYASHPLREETILKRILEKRGSTDGLTELDLAIDDVTQVTDQNHIGGVSFVRRLARLSEITPQCRILDLGSGLGGSARILASEFGCHVHGVDFSPQRTNEAIRLTQLTSLEHLVTFEIGDLRGATAQKHPYNVLWGQNSWVQIADKLSFVSRWSSTLTPSGRIALEDVVLAHDKVNAGHKRKLEKLEQQWKAYLTTAKEWNAILKHNDFTIRNSSDHTKTMKSHFVQLAKSTPRKFASSDEVAAWEIAVSLIDEGVLQYIRIIAQKSDRTESSAARRS